MAKRKRLGGPLEDYLATSDSSSTASTAPIARVAGEASVNAAFDEVSRELSSARTEGRLALRVPLGSIENAWLMRDRTHPGTAEDPDFAALLESLRRHGQRTPIEVIEKGQNHYGLISGWRRLTALNQLYEETGEERFATALVFLRQPERSEDAYVAMVEENEIRLGLSFYERARIAAKTVEMGVYPTPKAALQSLFMSASRAKRSKIGSFLGLYQVLGDLVRFPQALSERAGLSLARILEEDETAGKRLRARLKKSRAESPEAERNLFAAFIDAQSKAATQAQRPRKTSSQAPSPTHGRETRSKADPGQTEISPGVYLSQSGDMLQLSGPAVDTAFRDRLEAWLRKTGA